MIRPLTTMVLCGVLGSMVLVGNAEACHRKTCGHRATVCAARHSALRYARTLSQAGTLRDTNDLAPKHKLCFKLPTFCHKKAACAPAPVCYAYAAPVSYPTASPQASAQH